MGPPPTAYGLGAILSVVRAMEGFCAGAVGQDPDVPRISWECGEGSLPPPSYPIASQPLWRPIKPDLTVMIIVINR